MQWRLPRFVCCRVDAGRPLEAACGRKRWKNFSSSLCMDAFGMMVVRRKTTSSVLAARSSRNLNNSAKLPAFSAPGICSRLARISSCIRPPRITVCPLCTCSTDSISRISTCGTGFATQFVLFASQRLGFGSLTKGWLGRSRLMVGRTVSSTRPSSLTCGVTPITMPTATVLAVVLNVVVLGLVEPVVVCACTSK